MVTESGHGGARGARQDSKRSWNPLSIQLSHGTVRCIIHPCSGASSLPSRSRKWNAKGGGDPSRRWKSRTAFARVRGRRREWLLHRPGARASPHGRQHHAAGGRRHSSRAAACRGLVAFPAWLSGCSIVTGHYRARQGAWFLAMAACLPFDIFQFGGVERFLGTWCGWARRVVSLCGLSCRLNGFLVYRWVMLILRYQEGRKSPIMYR